MNTAQKNNSRKTTTPFKAKIALIIFGLFLCFLILETGLRLGGFLFLSLQEYRNVQSIKEKDTYRIICLGESSTAGQYPHFLEEALNQSNIGVSFSVIDKGIVAANTSAILSQVEDYLNVYNPDMVVTMMGINDRGKHIPFEKDTASKTMLLIRSFRIYKLIRLLWLHILTKAQEIGIHMPNRDKQLFKENPVKLMYAKSISNEDLFKKALERDPEDDWAYTELGWIYKKQGKHSEAIDLFRKAVKLNPANGKAYAGLGWICREQGKLPEAEDLFKKAIELNPENAWVYAELGWIYQKHGKHSEAEHLFKKAVELDPENDWAYTELGLVYRAQGKLSEAEYLFEKAIEFNPESDQAYTELGWVYQNQGKRSEAIDLFKKALKFNPDNDLAYGALSVLYQETGKPDLATEYANKANELRLGYYHSGTANNYRKLKEVLDKKGIRLVCVQYPMRSIEPLKNIFNQDKGIIFVDNERIFKQAVHQTSYKEYFTDMFGGDFGHCTEKGNRLLAKNIADTILKEIFDK
jgi:tetratricopeptide (TPR) repeat protein